MLNLTFYHDDAFIVGTPSLLSKGGLQLPKIPKKVGWKFFRINKGDKRKGLVDFKRGSAKEKRKVEGFTN